MNPEQSKPATSLGLIASEVEKFSLTRAILAVIDSPHKAGFELECSRTIAQNLGRVNDPNKIFVPYEVLERAISGRRDLSVNAGGGPGGGYLVATENVGFIDLLRNRAVVFRMGAQHLSGLRGNVTIPKQTAASTGKWLTNETTQTDETQQTFVQATLTPKTVAAYTEISRQLLLQSSPAADGIVSGDLAKTCALAVDLAAINGAGSSGEPDGIIGFDGVGTVDGTDLGYDGILAFQTDTLAANALLVKGGYATTPVVAKEMKKRVKFTNTASPLWEGSVSDGQMEGYPAMSSNQMPSSTMIFGDWNEMVIGEWGILEIMVNPFADFKAGIVGVRAMWTCDILLRNPAAFSVAESIT